MALNFHFYHPCWCVCVCVSHNLSLLLSKHKQHIQLKIKKTEPPLIIWKHKIYIPLFYNPLLSLAHSLLLLTSIFSFLSIKCSNRLDSNSSHAHSISHSNLSLPLLCSFFFVQTFFYSSIFSLISPEHFKFPKLDNTLSISILIFSFTPNLIYILPLFIFSVFVSLFVCFSFSCIHLN